MTMDTRARMLTGAAKAIATGGVEGMSLRDLANEAEVPLGSTYHYFPGGKTQLVEEAVRQFGAQVTRMIDDARVEGAEQVLQAFADRWRLVLEATDFRTGCPVAAAAVALDPHHHSVAREMFDDWHLAIVAALSANGIPAMRAPRLARMIMAATEGAVALSRAAHSTAPLDDVVEELTALIGAARQP